MHYTSMSLLHSTDMDRDKQVTALRPSINTVETKDIEQFQNEVLRPILKLQHPITLQLLDSSKHFTQQALTLDNRAKYEAQVEKYLQSDTAFRQRLIGTILGMMTSSELVYYSDHTREVNKRIMSMQVKRYVDTQYKDEKVSSY